MKSFFYNRSVYRVIGKLELPNCFLEIDDYFDSKFNDIFETMKNPFVIHTENICRRMSNIDFYALMIGDELESKTKLFESVILISSYLVGYFSSCKSFLDSLSIALNDIHKLQLSNKEKDFSKKSFWDRMNNVDSQIKDKYFSLNNLYREVIMWRDASIHRVTPLVVLHSPTPPEETPPELQSIKLYSDPNQFGVTSIDKTKEWYDVLELHNKWRPSFINLCEFIFHDIKKKI